MSMNLSAQRSITYFSVFVIVVISTTLFVLEKANEAIAEIDALSRVYASSEVGVREQEAPKLPAGVDRSQASTDEWKIYRSEQYGYEIRYPNLYSAFVSVSENLVSGELKRTITPPTSGSPKVYFSDSPHMFPCCEPVFVSIEVLDHFISDLQAFAAEKEYITPYNSYRIKQYGYEDFQGVRAYRIFASSGLDSPGNVILLNKGGRTFLIRANGGMDDFSANEIINSLRFF